MHRLKQLIHEIHRRSLWQVVGIYLAGSWVTLQVVGEITTALGLPEWVRSSAVVLLMVVFPIVVATAFVQEGAPGRGSEEPAEDPAASAAAAPHRSGEHRIPANRPLTERLLTWPKAILGGVLAFALLGVGTAGYMAMRNLGIGPAATLIAQEKMERGDTLVLADFQGPDSLLAETVTETLRSDLERSPAFTVLSPVRRREAIERMGRDPESGLSLDLAAQLARREGLKGAIGGRVQPAGQGYVLVARLVSADEGEPLVSERETAVDDGEVIHAIERLSRSLRERVGESLTSIRSSPRLYRVTTPSLEALKQFTHGSRLAERGERIGAIPHLEAAIAADSGMAAAYRKLSVVLANLGRDRARQVELAKKAYQFRDRLPERERVQVESSYHATRGSGDSAAAVLRRSIELHPEPWRVGRYNNLSVYLAMVGNLAEAESVLERLVALRHEDGLTLTERQFSNLVEYEYAQGKNEELRNTLERWRSAHPESQWRDAFLVQLAAGEGRFEEADSLLDVYSTRHEDVT